MLQKCFIGPLTGGSGPANKGRASRSGMESWPCLLWIIYIFGFCVLFENSIKSVSTTGSSLSVKSATSLKVSNSQGKVLWVEHSCQIGLILLKPVCFRISERFSTKTKRSWFFFHISSCSLLSPKLRKKLLLILDLTLSLLSSKSVFSQPFKKQLYEWCSENL